LLVVIVVVIVEGDDVVSPVALASVMLAPVVPVVPAEVSAVIGPPVESPSPLLVAGDDEVHPTASAVATSTRERQRRRGMVMALLEGEAEDQFGGTPPPPAVDRAKPVMSLYV
jgi:hypothetical protein